MTERSLVIKCKLELETLHSNFPALFNSFGGIIDEISSSGRNVACIVEFRNTRKVCTNFDTENCEECQRLIKYAKSVFFFSVVIQKLC